MAAAPQIEPVDAERTFLRFAPEFEKLVLTTLLAPCMAVAERNVDTALRKASQAGDLKEMQHQLIFENPSDTHSCPTTIRVTKL